jgi:hypothetical protein
MPYGAESGSVLMSINQLAIKAQTPNIEVEDSLPALVRRILKLDPKGRNIREVKDHIARHRQPKVIYIPVEITLGQNMGSEPIFPSCSFRRKLRQSKKDETKKEWQECFQTPNRDEVGILMPRLIERTISQLSRAWPQCRHVACSGWPV